MPPEAATNLELKERVQVAVREARRHHLGAWKESLDEHKKHPGFKTKQDVFSRKLGFTCDCTGEAQEWMLDIGTLRQMEQEARLQVERFLRHHQMRGMKAKKRKRRRAETKAKALLFRHLTREQKWQLRAGGSFWVMGSDGYEYQFQSKSFQSIIRHDCEGLPVQRLCIVPQYRKTGDLPLYDVMLAQKVLLEADINSFLETSYTTDLVGGGNPFDQYFRDDLRRRVRDIPERVLDDPVSWMLGQMGAPNVLMEDVTYGDAIYDTAGGAAWVLDNDFNVLVEFNHRVHIPPIHNPRQRWGPNYYRKALCRLLTAVPAQTYKEYEEVRWHFRGEDLGWVFALAHPNTIFPKRIRGVFRVHEPFLPPGKVYCLAGGEFLGFHVFVQETSDEGFGILNLNAIAIYETGICPRKRKQPRRPSRPSVRPAKPRKRPPSARSSPAPKVPIGPIGLKLRRKSSPRTGPSRRGLSCALTGTRKMTKT